MGERWRRAVGFPGYAVSDSGKVRNPRGGVLRGAITRGGSVQVRIPAADGRTKNVLVHRLVCRAFHGEPPAGMS